MRFVKLASLFAILALASCISGKPPEDVYTDQNGKTTVIQSDREQCEASCNESYSRCMETEPAQTNPMPGRLLICLARMPIAARYLRKCLPDCKSR